MDKEAYGYLQEWTEQNKTRTTYAPFFFKKCEIELANHNCKLIVEGKLSGKYKYNLLDDKGLILTGHMQPNTDGTHDYDLEFKFKADENTLNKELVLEVLQRFATAFLHANSFLWYGNIVDNKEYIASGKNEKQDKIITFRKYKDSVYAIPVGSHRSPEGVFSVRGHFRHYKKTGKTIWIDEYLKGTEN